MPVYQIQLRFNYQGSTEQRGMERYGKARLIRAPALPIISGPIRD